jgi:hypothetical protein
MNREALWIEIVRQNPSWHTDGARLSPEGIHKLFMLVWTQAEKWCYDEIRQASEASGVDGGAMDVFKGIFGMK